MVLMSLKRVYEGGADKISDFSLDKNIGELKRLGSLN